MIDLHVHSEFSYDSDAKMLDYINRAKELGLKHLYFTDHVDMQPIDPGYLYYEPRAYFEEYWKLKRIVETDDFYIHSGIEFGEPHLYPENLKRLAYYHYDVIIGSIQFVFALQIKSIIINNKKINKDVRYNGGKISINSNTYL